MSNRGLERPIFSRERAINEVASFSMIVGGLLGVFFGLKTASEAQSFLDIFEAITVIFLGVMSSKEGLKK